MKSERNKTIVLDVEEKERLSKQIKEGYFINSVINGDMFDKIKLIPDASVDLLVADPPYNLTKVYSKTKFPSTDTQAYLKWTESWISLVLPKLKSNASIYICNDWRCSALQIVLEKHFIIQNRITFEREKGRGAKANWKSASEDIWFCTVSNDYVFNLDDVKIKRKVIAPYVNKDGKAKDWTEDEDGKFRLTCPSNLWTDLTIPFWSMAENTEHPTQKPEKLIAKIMLASSNKGDTILDPFGGSGTTGVVAKKLGRNFILIEPEKEYCLAALKRLEMAETNKEIQGYKDGIFLDRNVK